jgi:hypothetical protein
MATRSGGSVRPGEATSPLSPEFASLLQRMQSYDTVQQDRDRLAAALAASQQQVRELEARSVQYPFLLDQHAAAVAESRQLKAQLLIVEDEQRRNKPVKDAMLRELQVRWARSSLVPAGAPGTGLSHSVWGVPHARGWAAQRQCDTSTARIRVPCAWNHGRRACRTAWEWACGQPTTLLLGLPLLSLVCCPRPDARPCPFLLTDTARRTRRQSQRVRCSSRKKRRG